jgi:serine/threonine protein kinase
VLFRSPESVVAAIGCDILRALHVAHTATDHQGRSCQIIHRDLKPANVLMARAGIAKIGDFGLAKTADDTLNTVEGKIKGTPAYIPPESWSGSRDFQPTMDLFTVGAIPYECVLGERLFKGDKVARVFKQVFSRTAEQEIRPILKEAPALAPVLLRLLQRNPKDRYQTAAAALAELEVVHARVDVGCDLATFMALLPGGPDLSHASMGPATLRFPKRTDLRWSRFLKQTTGRDIPVGPVEAKPRPPPSPPKSEPEPEPDAEPPPRRRKTQAPGSRVRRRLMDPMTWIVLAAALLVAALALAWFKGL